jgi:hypothetical protein
MHYQLIHKQVIYFHKIMQFILYMAVRVNKRKTDAYFDSYRINSISLYKAVTIITKPISINTAPNSLSLMSFSLKRMYP